MNKQHDLSHQALPIHRVCVRARALVCQCVMCKVWLTVFRYIKAPSHYICEI